MLLSGGLGHYQPFASWQEENLYHEDENKTEKADNAGYRKHDGFRVDYLQTPNRAGEPCQGESSPSGIGTRLPQPSAMQARKRPSRLVDFSTMKGAPQTAQAWATGLSQMA